MWMRRGRCSQSDVIAPDFFALDEEGIAEAKAFCVPCPVRQQCLEFAMTDIDSSMIDQKASEMGVYGGMDGSERLRIRVERKERNASDGE
jgi:hypothetical protein